MNPSTAAARVIIDELIRCGVSDVVLAPGSRSAPLAMAAADAAEAGFLSLHVRIDERSAGYLAVGLARGTGVPVAVITTSGTAAVNLHPAVVEAYYSRVPILLLTADRPPELQDVSANQTIRQTGLFGSHLKAEFDLGVPRYDVGQVRFWRSTVARACAAAADATTAGPVHLNCPFSDPLVPDEDFAWIEDIDGRVNGDGEPMPWTIDARMVGAMSTPIDDVLELVTGDPAVPERGLIVVGDLDDDDACELIEELSTSLGWPVIAEPSSGCGGFETSIAHGSVLLADDAFFELHQPDLVLTVGVIGLARSVLRAIRSTPLHVAVDSHAPWPDPTRSANVVIAGVPLPPEAMDLVSDDDAWLRSWTTADIAAESAIESVLAGVNGLTGPAVARAVTTALADDELLFLGPSWPVRHVDGFASVSTGSVRANRGTSGIDGTVSSAWGAAVTHQRAGGGNAYALIGDLTFLYDDNGLVVPEVEPRPDLTYVVIDNDGGGIFSALEQGDARFASTFERVFGTPHGKDLAVIAASLGVDAVTVTSLDELTRSLMAPFSGVRVIVARTGSRRVEAALLTELSRAISAAV